MGVGGGVGVGEGLGFVLFLGTAATIMMAIIKTAATITKIPSFSHENKCHTKKIGISVCTIL